MSIVYLCRNLSGLTPIFLSFARREPACLRPVHGILRRSYASRSFLWVLSWNQYTSRYDRATGCSWVEKRESLLPLPPFLWSLILTVVVSCSSTLFTEISPATALGSTLVELYRVLRRQPKGSIHLARGWFSSLLSILSSTSLLTPICDYHRCSFLVCNRGRVNADDILVRYAYSAFSYATNACVSSLFIYLSYRASVTK